MDFYNYLAYALTYIGLLATSFYIVNMFFYYRTRKEPQPKEDKSVTILIPAYNEEKSIARTIKSAINLDYPAEKLEIG